VNDSGWEREIKPCERFSPGEIKMDDSIVGRKRGQQITFLTQEPRTATVTVISPTAKVLMMRKASERNFSLSPSPS
jgi:hypothetical protein